MTSRERDDILESIQNIRKLNFNKIISEFSDAPLEQKEIIGEYSKEEYINIFNRTINQLDIELTNGMGTLLPSSLYINSEDGEIVPFEILGAIENLLIEGDLSSTLSLLKLLVYFQISLGFWDRSSVNIHRPDSIAIEEMIEKNKANDYKLVKMIESAGEVLNNLISKDEEYVRVLSVVSGYSVALNDTLAAASSKRDSIDDELNVANNTVTKIQGILDVQENELSRAKSDFKERADEHKELLNKFDLLDTEIKSLIASLKKEITENKKSLSQAKEELDYIDSRKSDIERYTSMAADGSLGTKFDQRKSDLSKSVTGWAIVVGIMAFVSIVWSICVFTIFTHQSSNEWISFVVNFLKTAPAYFMLGFTINQYRKERNLQEEYAFKSAISMTLTAYSEMLSDADEPSNKARIDMLARSIEQIYGSPRIHTEATKPLLSFNSRDVSNSLKSLVETIKEIKK